MKCSHQTEPDRQHLTLVLAVSNLSYSVSFCLTRSKSQLTLSGGVERADFTVNILVALLALLCAPLCPLRLLWLTFEHETTVGQLESGTPGSDCQPLTDWLQAEDSGAIWALPGNGTCQPANNSLTHKYNEDISSDCQDKHGTPCITTRETVRD